MKLVLLLVIVGVIACCSHGQRITGSWGNATNFLLHREVIRVSYVPLRVRERTFVYRIPSNRTTQAIRGVIHRENRENGDTRLKLIRGGLNTNFVELLLRSQRGKRINSIIEIYG